MKRESESKSPIHSAHQAEAGSTVGPTAARPVNAVPRPRRIESAGRSRTTTRARTERVRETALKALSLGFSVVPPKEDGSKSPTGSSWGEYQERLPSEEEVRAWYKGGRHGVGLVTGHVSGGLELFEFDDHATYLAFKEQAEAVGLGGLVDRIEAGYCEGTPADGIHWFILCPDAVDPNTKLAARPPAPGSEDKSNKVLIETRGEGGYAIVAPSCGPIHPSRKPYRLLSGGLETIAVLTPEEKDDLWDLARSLDEIPPKLVEDRRGGARPSQGTRPGDDFAATVSWPEILEPHGWKLSGRNGEKSSWTRPGKARGMSASTNHAGFDLLYVFSTSTAFEAGRGYSKFTAYTVLNHDGDFEAAAAELGRQGFGTASALTRTASDLGNAERLVDQHGDSIKHVREWKKWLFWDGTRWQRDQTGEVERRAKQTVRTIYTEAAGIDDKDGRQAMARFALRSEAYLATQHLLQQAMTEARVARTPVDFDQDPWLLNCLNGTVDLRTGQLAAHDPEHLITKLAPVAYDPTATDARWDSFIAEATGGDGELAAFLQACAGYSLTGDISEQKMFFIHGPGATGKSTFLEAIKGVLGDYAATADFETFVARPTSGGPRNDVARLQGKRMILSIEVDEGKKLAESLVKSLTGGDTVAARFLYTETVEFTPEGKLWLAANNLPVVRASDEAIWRRILLVPFVHVVPEARRDPRLKQSFVSDPALRSAILGWAIRGCLHWQRSGLRPPEAVAEATQDYRQEMNPLTQFIEDCCELRVGATVTAATLYRTYLDWVANEYSLSTVPKGKMLDSLRAFGVEAGKATGGERIYVGIQIAMD